VKASYDRIGAGYSKVRRPDPRLAALITQALGDARTVLNVGAGAASSTFATLPGDVVEPAMRRLAADLASGAWARRHGDLLHRDTMDYGYRLIISG
jgi:hypothetical protein